MTTKVSGVVPGPKSITRTALRGGLSGNVSPTYWRTATFTSWACMA